MGDIFDKISSVKPTGDIFDQAASAPLPSAASPIAPPAIPSGLQNPKNYPGFVPTRAYLDTGNPVPPSPSIKDMVSSTTRSGIQVSAPGILASIGQKYAPNVTNSLLNMLPSDARQLITPLNKLPGQMTTTMAPIIAGGLDEPQPTIQPRPAAQVSQSVQSPVSGPTIGSIMARHIPLVGRALRTMDDVQALLGKDSPHPTATGNIAPVKTPVPETNGIQWGTGGQGPLDLRGKMIPPENQPAQIQTIPLPNITPTKASVIDPYRAQVLPPMTKGVSGNVEAHAYDPSTSTMYTHFKSGDIYRYEGVPQQVYNQFQNAESQGSFHYNNIRGRYDTTKIGKVAPTRTRGNP